MIDNRELLKKAIAALPIRDLLRKLNVAGEIPERDGVKFSSPLRPDQNPSCTIYDGRLHDWSLDEHLDAFDVFQRLMGQDSKAAFVPFVEMAGYGQDLNGTGEHVSKNTGVRKQNNAGADWSRDFKKLSETDITSLAEWRGYSQKFCRWLSEKGLIGRSRQYWAFPVWSGLRMVSIHVRRDKHNWFFTPKLTCIGEELTPLVTEGLSTASKVFIAESQWDLFVALDITQGHKTDGVAGISTRGSGNAKLCAGIIPESAEIIALVQNDRPGSEWLNNLVQTLGREIKVLRPPDGIHDINDWIKSVGGKEQLLKAVAGELPQQSPNIQTEHGSLLDEHATEQQLAGLLKSELPPIRCVGEDWFVYQYGLWKNRSRNDFKPRALSIQNLKTRTARRASNVLNHIEFEQQSLAEEFRSFCCFDKSGAILINCTNGVLRIAANGVKLLLHGPEHLFTGQLAGRYDPEASAATFERVLQEALPDRADLDLFRIYSGYLLYPDCRFEAALVCYGPGGTGKSTLSQAIENVIGSDLVRHLSLEQICNPQSKLVAQLQLMALNVSTELNAIETVGGETFKQLVSGERVQADRKYLDDVCLCTGCKHWFNTNYLPRFRHGTDAELRRLRILRFDKKPQSIDVTLKEKLNTERDGILLFMIDGLRALMERNEIPAGGQESLRTRERFDIQNNPIGAFVKTECTLGPAEEIEKAQVFDAYEKFCERNGIPLPPDKGFFFKELLTRFAVQNVRRRDGNDRIQKLVGIDLRG